MKKLCPVALIVIASLSCSGGSSGGGTTGPDTQTPSTPASVTVSPSTATLQGPDASQQLTATVRDQSGAVMSGQTVSWTSSNAQVASVSSGGLVSAVASGSATVTAALGALSGAATITVSGFASTVTITPALSTFTFAGQAVRLSASVTDASGAAVNGAAVTWSSDNPSVLSVSSDGVVTALADGSAAITATSGGISATVQGQVAISVTGHAANPTDVPVGGNAWVVNGDGTEWVAADGANGWAAANSIVRVYFRVTQPGTLRLSTIMVGGSGDSEVTLSVAGVERLIPVTAGTQREYFAGEFNVPAAGYVAVDLRGDMRAGDLFGRPVTVRASGTAVTPQMAFIPNDNNNLFYFGRRGPSPNFGWVTPGTNMQWLYSELTVEPGQDVVGTYWMANGFTNGYFGMQANSDTQRQFIFSIWSPFETDDPLSIPEDKRVRPLRSGTGVIIAEFGNEGSGGQSRLPFMWAAGTTYRFLTQATRNGDGSTTYTAWVFLPETNQWTLIASFLRPDTDAWFSGVYSFLENFEPEQGTITRRGIYERQWVADENGQWTEVTGLTLGTDATGNGGFRVDFTGGLDGGRPFLQMGGFFDTPGVPGTLFTRPASAGPPVIDFSILP